MTKHQRPDLCDDCGKPAEPGMTNNAAGAVTGVSWTDDRTPEGGPITGGFIEVRATGTACPEAFARRLGRRIRDLQAAAQRPDTPEQIRWRIASREAASLAIEERQKRYPYLTADCADEALRYQEERIKYHTERLLKGEENRDGE